MTKHDAPLAVLAAIDRSKSHEARSPEVRIAHRASPDLARPRDTTRRLRKRSRSARRTPTRAAAETTGRCLEGPCHFRPSRCRRAPGIRQRHVIATTAARVQPTWRSTPGSPVTKTFHASSHWRTKSSRSIAVPVPRGLFLWRILAPPRQRCSQSTRTCVLLTVSCPRRSRSDFAESRVGPRTRPIDGSGHARCRGGCPRTSSPEPADRGRPRTWPKWSWRARSI